MDDLFDLFTPEALRLLDATSPLPIGCPVLDDPVTPKSNGDISHESQSQLRRKREIESPVSFGQGCATVDSAEARTEEPKQKRVRSKFADKRRVEVANNRKKGACLKCRIDKIPCSGSWPCQSCQRSRVSCRGREPQHQWMQCVPFSFKGMDVFSMGHFCETEEFLSIMRRRDFIIHENVKLAFETPVPWDVDLLSIDFADWMANEQPLPPSTSRVGILSSFGFEHLVSTFLDKNLQTSFRVLVKTSSTLYSRGSRAWYEGYSASEYWTIASFAGTQVLQKLEKALSNNSLAKRSSEELKSLFLLLLGTILAVGYFNPFLSSDIYHQCGLEDFQLSLKVFEDMRHQLICVLTHHMILLAERTSLLSEDIDKTALLEDAHRQWNRKATFEWVESIHSTDPNPEIADSESITVDVDDLFTVFACGHTRKSGSNSFNTSLCAACKAGNAPCDPSFRPSISTGAIPHANCPLTIPYYNGWGHVGDNNKLPMNDSSTDAQVSSAWPEDSFATDYDLPFQSVPSMPYDPMSGPIPNSSDPADPSWWQTLLSDQDSSLLSSQDTAWGGNSKDPDDESTVGGDRVCDSGAYNRIANLLV